MSSHTTGRHRAPCPVSAAPCLSSAISRSIAPAGKASAVIVISGAMVASPTLPASAAAPGTRARSAPSVALAVRVAPPSAAQAPLAPQTFGNIRFDGVAKVPPAPRVAVRPTELPVSRSTTRVPPPAPASRSGKALSIAASLAGIYYVYGGTTPAGFDCSGYTQYVFGKAGISLPRTAEAQRQASTRVTNPQPGDLVSSALRPTTSVSTRATT